ADAPNGGDDHWRTEGLNPNSPAIASARVELSDCAFPLSRIQSSGSAVQLSWAGYHKAKEEHGLVAVRHTPGLKRGPVAQPTYCAQVCRYPVQQVDGKLGPKRHVIGAEVAWETKSETALRIEAPGDCPGARRRIGVARAKRVLDQGG